MASKSDEDDKKETSEVEIKISSKDFDPFLNQVPMAPCLEIEPLVFKEGFKPILLSSMSACLGPINIIKGALKLAAKPPKFLKKLALVSPPLLPALCLDYFKAASISFGMPPIKIKLPAPFEGEISFGDVSKPKLDVDLQLKSYIKFVLGLLKLPLEILLGIVEKLLKFDFNINIKDLILKAIAASINFPIDIKLMEIELPKLSENFAKCLTDMLLVVFAPLAALLGGAAEGRKDAVVENSKKALSSHEDGDDKDALEIINENKIKPKEYKDATGHAAFFRLKEKEEFEAVLI